ncbi:hypothetical protein QOT17_021808 [Balamuthia mandrillaris]
MQHNEGKNLPRTKTLIATAPMMNATPTMNRTHVYLLPSEILIAIFSFLDVTSLASASSGMLHQLMSTYGSYYG